MEIGKALELLRQYKDEIAHLRTLRHSNNEHRLWADKVNVVLADTFERNSYERNVFDSYRAFAGWSPMTEADRQENYLNGLDECELAITKILQKYEIIGIPATPETGQAQASEDSAEGEGNTKAELEQFHAGFVKYKKLVLAQKDLAQKRLILPNKQITELQTLRSELPRKYGRLKEVLEKYGGSTEVLLEGGNYKCEAFTAAFSYTPFSLEALTDVMDTAIAAINIAIGNIAKLPLPETGQVQAPEDSTQMANSLFDKMQFHPRVAKASESRFKSGHYSDAIFAAFKAINNFVKQRTRSTLDGKSLMLEVFSKNNPIIKLNEGRTDSDKKDEQEGFMHLFAGAMQGIRNPKAHDEVAELSAYKTLEYLGFASLLMRRVEERKLKRTRKKQVKSPKS